MVDLLTDAQDDVEKIKWAYYITTQAERGVDCLGYIRQIEGALRSRGGHVLGDGQGIWVFSLSEAEEIENFDRYLIEHCFKLVCSGTENAQGAVDANDGVSISKLAGGPTSAAYVGDRGQSNTHAYVANARVSRQLEEMVLIPNPPDFAPKYLRNKFISAILQSLCSGLAKDPGYLQLGRNICIDVYTLADTISEDSELLKANESSTSVSFSISWLSSGALLITYTSEMTASLSIISQLIPSHPLPDRLPLGIQCLLSPVGLIGYFLGLEIVSTQDSQHSVITKLKVCTSEVLSRIGTPVSENSTWIYIQLDSPWNDDKSTACYVPMVNPRTILWPANLCICLNPDASLPTLSINERLDTEAASFIDPLTDAEDWWVSRGIRSRALELKQQSLSLEAQKSRELEENEEELTLFDGDFDQGVTPQDVRYVILNPALQIGFRPV